MVKRYVRRKASHHRRDNTYVCTFVRPQSRQLEAMEKRLGTRQARQASAKIDPISFFACLYAFPPYSLTPFSTHMYVWILLHTNTIRHTSARVIMSTLIQVFSDVYQFVEA